MINLKISRFVERPLRNSSKKKDKTKMKRLAVVVGVAAVATLAGCKNPNFKRSEPDAEAKVVPANTADEKVVTPVETMPKAVEEVKKDDVVTPKSDESKVEAPKIDESKVEEPKEVEETTTYIIQRGDTLSKISKKYNIKLQGILAVNPQIKDSSKIRLGQKIKLPGKVDVGAQTVPAGAFATTKKPANEKPAKVFKPYEGATEDYTVKSGDTLGAIAYSRGINVRQLKKLNNLTNDNLKIGQKLKVPAKAAKENKAVVVAPVNPPASVVTPKPEEPVVEPAPAEETPVVESEPVVPTVAAPEIETVDHVVGDKEDLIGIAMKRRVNISEIRDCNPLIDCDNLKEGMVIKVPVKSSQE
jgi:peptidoglycan endopeptidase LytE